MVYLYGVVHGGHWRDIFGGRSGEMDIFPSRDLTSDLQKFPRGTNVGIETLSGEDWKEVTTHMATAKFNPPWPRFRDEYGGRFPASRPVYNQRVNRYWGEIKRICSELGFGVVPLETKNLWLKYNKAMLRFVENEERRSNRLVLERGESQEHYDRKRVRFNSERHQENTFIRKIHEIEREKQIIEAIKSSNVNVAFVGFGHANIWVANPQVCSDLGLKIEGYSSEVPKDENSPYGGPTVFTKTAKLDQRRIHGRRTLERAIRLLETGRLCDKKPDFVGTWELNTPAEGYFEMFVNRDGRKVSGEIVDCLGDADFEGEMDARRIKFVKEYREVLNDVPYKGIIRDGKIIGYFKTEGLWQAFYAAQGEAKDTVDLGVSWDLMAKKYKKGLKSLRERLSDKKAN